MSTNETDSQGEVVPMEVSIDKSPLYFALSAYIAELTENQTITEPLSSEEVENLRSLVVNLLDYLGQLPEGAILSAENTSAQTSVFRLLSYSISLLHNEKEINELKERLNKIENENCDLIQQNTDLQKQNQNSIQNLAKNLELYGVQSSQDFVEQVRGIKESQDRLMNDLIEQFNLSPKATPSTIVQMLVQKFEDSKLNVSMEAKADADELNLSQRKEYKATIKELHDDIEDRDNQIELKDGRISVLEATISDMKKRLATTERLEKDNERLTAALDKANAEMQQMQTDLQKAEKSRDKKKKQLQSLQERFEQLAAERNNISIDNETLAAEIEMLHQKAGKPTQAQQIEIDSYAKKLERCENEKKHLLDLIDQFTQQFEQQADELAQETKDRTTLVIAVQRLSLVNHELEKQLEIAQKNAENALKKATAAQPKPVIVTKEPVKENNDFEDLIKAISNCAQDCQSYDVSTAIARIVDDISLPAQEKVEEIIKTLIQMIDTTKSNGANQLNEAQSENANLITAFASVVKFIEKLCASGEVINWTPKSSSPEEIQSSLKAQIDRINKFIHENAEGLVEESNFYECLSYDSNASNFEDKTSEIFNKYSTVKTQEGKELFLLLTQAIIANDVLRRFANEAKLQCEQQSSDVKVVRNTAEVARKELENHYEEQICQLNAQLQDEKTKYDELVQTTSQIKVILQNATTRNVECSDILDCIQNINDRVPSLNENEYVSELEKVLATRSNDYKQLKEESEEKIKSLEEQVNSLEEQIKETKETSEKTQEEQMKSIQSITKSLEESEQLVQKLKEENQNLHDTAETAKDEVIKQTAELQEQLFKATTELDSLHDAYDIALSNSENEKAILNKQLKDALAKIESIKTQCKAAIKKKVAAVVAKSECEMQKNADIIAQYDSTLEALKQQITDNENTIQSLNDTIVSLTEEKKDVEENYAKLQLEQKVMNTKLMSREEKIKRDKSMYETQMKLKMFALETDMQAKFDAARSSASNQIQILLQSLFEIVNNAFNASHMDSSIEPIINEETIKSMLEEVCEKAKRSDDLDKQLSRTAAELETLKTALGVTTVSRATSAIADFVKQIEAQKEQIARIQDENKQMKSQFIHVRSAMQQEKITKEWEDWARKLYLIASDGMCSVKSAKEIRYAVEEVVYAAMKERVVWRRLDTLRNEKKLILIGAQNAKAKPLSSTILPIITLMKFILRTQKLSGHSRAPYIYERITPNTNQTDKDSTQQVEGGENPDSNEVEKKPLFSKFIVSKVDENVVDN